ncbi:2Fe-2S iron-sulfur cluster-binding protein [Paucihalobacter ruber]|nr:2Fe-2S iron-sulfur cluster-binding protein [Paucihalobacter ruber]
MRSLKLILMGCCFLIVLSCDNEDLVENQDLSFDEVEVLFNMKQPFSEKSKTLILNHYGSVKNYYEFASDRITMLTTNKVDHLNFSRVPSYQLSIWNRDQQEWSSPMQRCPSNVYILDHLEDQGYDFPYSCRCGADSTDAMKLRGGRVDQSDQTFLNDTQLAMGFFLPSVSYPLEDIVADSHMEEFLY